MSLWTPVYDHIHFLQPFIIDNGFSTDGISLFNRLPRQRNSIFSMFGCCFSCQRSVCVPIKEYLARKKVKFHARRNMFVTSCFRDKHLRKHPCKSFNLPLLIFLSSPFLFPFLLTKQIERGLRLYEKVNLFLYHSFADVLIPLFIIISHWPSASSYGGGQNMAECTAVVYQARG